MSIYWWGRFDPTSERKRQNLHISFHMATLNEFNNKNGQQQKINKRVLQAFNAVYNKLMFHIDFPFNWERKINWHTHTHRWNENQEKKKYTENESQIKRTENNLFHWCYFCRGPIEKKKGKTTSIEWIWNKSQFIYAYKHLNTHKTNFKANFFPMNSQPMSVRLCIING